MESTFESTFTVSESPIGRLPSFLIERNYKALGCDSWDSRRVKLLCAKMGDTLEVMAARMRLRPGEFKRRMDADRWTDQDGLILTILEQEIDRLRGGKPPAGIINR